MDVLEAIKNRQSVRAFLNKEVAPSIIKSIFDIARFAPSGVNHQPWKVVVLGPKCRTQLSNKILNARTANQPPNPDYNYYPKEWTEPYKSRRISCGKALYGALNIQREDTEKRLVQWNLNYSFFNAPIALIFYLEKHLAKGSWMDMGIFLQNVMLAARGHGLETCPQAALAEYPDIVREVLKISSDNHIVCGMAMGYADWSHPINNYHTVREPIENFVQWIE